MHAHRCTHTQIHIAHTQIHMHRHIHTHTHYNTTHHTLYSLIRVKCFELRKTKQKQSTNSPLFFYYYYNLCHYYISSSIIGFISKVKAQECLNQRENGTFLLRFSDSECGGITIAWIAESQTNPGRPEQVFTVGWSGPTYPSRLKVWWRGAIKEW